VRQEKAKRKIGGRKERYGSVYIYSRQLPKPKTPDWVYFTEWTNSAKLEMVKEL
jgi:hypothetical protein